jgi:protease PrsW
MSAQPPPPAVEQPTEAQPAEPKGRSGWWRTILTGIVLYIAGLVLLVVSGNPNLFPTVVMIGSFMVPAAYVAFFYERRHLSRLTFSNTVFSFFWGGVLGVFAATILEPIFVSGNGSGLGLGTAFQVGLVEEFVKVLGVLWIARTIRHNSELDGLIIGAAAGMGFASLESTGYAFTAFLESQGSLSALVAVTLLRGLLSPLGHGTWTAILVGVLFRESSSRRFHVNRAVVGAYLTVVILHGLWDGLPGFLAAFMTSGLDIFLAQVAVGAAGVIILWRRWREAVRLQRTQLAAEAAPASPVIPDGSPDGGKDGRHDDGHDERA